MTVDELRAACARGERITLKLPAVRLSSRTDPPRRRLCGKRGPLGVVLCEGREGHVVAFDSKKVLEFLDAAEAAERGE